MTDDDAAPGWPGATFPAAFQQSSEEALERQMDLFRKFLSMSSGTLDGMPGAGTMGTGTAVFKTRVQSGGRISIPDAEREALDIEEGDIVQSVLIPIKRDRE